MTCRILLTGKTGQIGSALLPLLKEFGEVVAPGRRDLDLLDTDSIRRTLRETRPELIINAAAYTAVDAAETHESEANAINAVARGVLAEEATKLGAVVVHYSTDYVVDGAGKTPYEETDLPAPINIYGKTKLAGENAVCLSGVPHLIFRTAWIYSTQGRNFLRTVLRLATEREELRIVNDQLGAPTWSYEVANATSQVLAQLTRAKSSVAAAVSQVSGTYHMTAEGATTWFDFARAILEEAAQLSPDLPWFVEARGGRPLLAKKIIPVTSAEFLTPAKRPAFSVLSSAHLARQFGVALPDWRTQLRLVFQSNRRAHMHVPQL